MPTQWTITLRAQREYCALRRWDTTDAELERAERELQQVMALAHEVGEQDNGLILFRGAAPARLRLLVSAEDELVSVLPGHDGQRAHTSAVPEPMVTIPTLPKIPRSQSEAWVRAAGGLPNLSRWIVQVCNEAARKAERK